MTTPTQPTLLVTGASGTLGRLVLGKLLDELNVPAASIVATTRKPESLAEFAQRGVIVRKADFEDSASLTAAFAGVQRLLLISTDAIDRPGRRLQQHRNAVAAARAAGVQHVVYTSMPNPEPGSPIPFAPDHHGTEQALAACGLGWTVLRNHWYFENLLGKLPQIFATGKWITAAGAGNTADVSREDAARAAAAALASHQTGNATYDISGPEALSTAQIAALVSEVTGRKIEVVPVGADALTEGLIAAGLPGFVVPIVVGFDVTTLRGLASRVSGDVEKLTGRKPQTLREFLVANKPKLLA